MQKINISEISIILQKFLKKFRTLFELYSIYNSIYNIYIRLKFFSIKFLAKFSILY